MRPFGRRTGGRLARLSAFAVLTLALVVSGAGAAAATGGDNGRPDSTGNNGTLKIHEYGTPTGTENNDPKVCIFNVEGFNFDPGQQLVLKFEVQGGDEPTGVVPTPNEFSVQANAGGYFPSGYFNNPRPEVVAGHYKVTAYGKDTGTGLFTDEKAKSKVFKVSCAAPAPETGTVTVTKALAEGSAPAHDKKFAITVSCESANYSKTFHLKVGESGTTDALPVDTACTVTEQTTDGWQTPEITPDQHVTVGNGAATSVTVTNYKPKHEPDGKTGTITVTKALAEGSEQPSTAQIFPVTVTCDKVKYSKTFNLAVGDSATTDPLPVGTKCTVSEDPPDGWDTPVVQPSAEVTVHKGDTAVTVVNNWTSQPPQERTGKIKVTKALASGTVAEPGQTFAITVACEKAGYDKTFAFSLAAGDSKVLKKLPVGAVCTVSEAYPSGWDKPSIQPTPTVTVTPGLEEVTVVNSRTVTPPPTPTPWASLTIDKTSPQATAVLGGTVTYNLTVAAGGTMGQTNVRVSDPIPAGTSYVVTSAKCVDNRTPCTVTEPTVSDPTVHWALGTMSAGETVTVTFQVTVSSSLQPGTEVTNVGYVQSDQKSAQDELVLPTAEVKGEVIVGPTTPTEVTPAAVEGETLPATGAAVPIGYLIGTGVGLIALGALLTALTRRGRSA